MAQLYIFRRYIGWLEIDYLQKNFGNTPFNISGVTGQYTFSGDLQGGPLIGTGVGYDATLVSGGAPAYPVVDNSTIPVTMALAPSGNSVIQLGDYVLPDSSLGELSLNFWYQERMDNSQPVNLFHIYNPSRNSDPKIELTIEPGGIIALTVGTNWSRIWYRPGPGFDGTDGHMITVRLRN